MKYPNLDKFDTALLAILQHNARASFAEMGEQIGLSASAVHKRARLLEAAGVIDRHVAVLNERALQLKNTAFVQVTLKNQQEPTLTAFEQAVALHAEVMECYLMAGSSDYFLRITCRDTEDYERIHKQLLTRLPGVERVISNFAIRKIFSRSALPLSFRS